MKDFFYLENDKLIFCYVHDYYEKKNMLKNIYEYSINLKGLNLKKENLVEDERIKEYFIQLESERDYYDDFEDNQNTLFYIGDVKDDYVYLDKDVFQIENNFAIKKALLSGKIDSKMFFIYTSSYKGRTAVVNIISKYANCDCYICEDGDLELGKNGYIPFSDYNRLISSFPTKTELQKYQATRIANIIGDYFDNSDALQKYNDYMKKKGNKNKKYSIDIAAEYDIDMYDYIIKELEAALKNTNISEEEWQKKLVPIICLLYPRYVTCLSKVPIIHNDDFSDTKELDCLLVDIEGNCCILELKKPFNGEKLLTNSYRKNFYQPKFKLAGGVQQIEEYIYDLNLYKKENIKSISKKYSEEIDGIDINLVDVQGILICGRSNDFSKEEKRDFEIIRNQYKNVIDLLTYDDIIQRLKKTIELFKKKLDK